MNNKETVFIIRNQNRLYLDKHGQWCAGEETRHLYRTPHHDEALNTLIELSAKDINLRGKVIEAALDDKMQPAVEPAVSEAGQSQEADHD